MEYYELKLKQIQEVLPKVSDKEFGVIYHFLGGYLGYDRLIGEVEGE